MNGIELHRKLIFEGWTLPQKMVRELPQYERTKTRLSHSTFTGGKGGRRRIANRGRSCDGHLTESIQVHIRI